MNDNQYPNLNLLMMGTFGSPHYKYFYARKGESEEKKMKKIKDYMMAMKFMTVCCGIAAVMGLIERHDNQKYGT